MTENDGKKLYWDWEHRMRTECIARRPDLTLENTAKKTILLNDIACPNGSNKGAKREEKMRKYQQLCFELRERRKGYTVIVIPMIIGCLGGEIKELKANVKRIFDYHNDKELELIAREMQKTVLWESESLMRKILSRLLTRGGLPQAPFRDSMPLTSN